MGVHQLVGWVLALSAINWGLVGLMDTNLVAMLFGSDGISRVVYVLVGVAGVYKVYMLTMGKKK